MLAYIMIAILAVLAFLCISHVIPALARRKTSSNSPSQVDSEANALRYTHPHARSIFKRNIASRPLRGVNDFPATSLLCSPESRRRKTASTS